MGAPAGGKIAIYESGSPRVVHRFSAPQGAVVEVELSDGRTVQLTVDCDGRVQLRGWGNVPALVGNDTTLSLYASVERREATHDENYQRLPEGGSSDE